MKLVKTRKIGIVGSGNIGGTPGIPLVKAGCEISQRAHAKGRGELTISIGEAPYESDKT